LHCLPRVVQILRMGQSRPTATIHVLSSFERCYQRQPYPPSPGPVMSFPLSHSALGGSPILVAALSANGHFGVLSSIERCSQLQPYLSMDIHVLPPFLICSERQPYLPLDISVSFPLCSLRKTIPVLHRPSWPRATWTVSTGISFDHYHQRCRDFCLPLGFLPDIGRKTVHSAQALCTEPRLLGGGGRMVASRNGLTRRVIP
jgi:hypothetical protein